MRKNFDNFAFLELYRDLPVLWDRTHPDYKNRRARDDAENKMLEVFDFDCARELRNKIRSLRNTYNLELQRINASIKNGADPDDAYTPKLVWFGLADSFLGKNVDEAGDLTENWTDNGRDYDDYQGTAEASDPILLTVKTEKQSAKKRAKKRDRDSPKRKLRKSHDITSKLISSVQTSEELVGANEFVVFGQLVAIQLEKLPLETALQMQQEIQTILNRARLSSLRGKYEEVNYLENEQDPISDQDSSS